MNWSWKKIAGGLLLTLPFLALALVIWSKEGVLAVFVIYGATLGIVAVVFAGTHLLLADD